MSFCVYIFYEDSESAIPIYVGMGNKLRPKTHLRPSALKGTHPWAQKLRQMLKNGIIPYHEFAAEDLSYDEAFNLEKYLISKFGRIIDGSGSLYNYLEAGTGYTRGFKQSDEWRKEQSIRNQGNKYSVGKIDPRRRPIGAFLLDIMVYKFDFVRQVEEEGFSSRNVSNCLSGRCKTHQDLEWRYL